MCENSQGKLKLGNGIKYEKDEFHSFMYGKTENYPKPIYRDDDHQEFYSYVNPKYSKKE